jgi:hypothetical protein
MAASAAGVDHPLCADPKDHVVVRVNPLQLNFLTKPITMKKFIVFLLLVILATGCSRKPDNKIHNQKTEKGDWIKDSVTNKPVQENVVYYQISPTWGQSFEWASQRGDRALQVIVALILFILFVALIVGTVTGASWLPQYFENPVRLYAVLFVLLSGAFYFYTGSAFGVKWNNDKWVTKQVYEKAIKEAGSTQPIWDSLQNNCLIIDGPYNCEKK